MPRHAQREVDNTILVMAIVGYQSQLERLSEGWLISKRNSVNAVQAD